MASVSFGAAPAPLGNIGIFIDGTNLIYRLESTKLKIDSIKPIVTQHQYLQGRNLTRIYFYTIQHHYDRARELFGASFFDGIRVIFGDQAPISGNFKEKGVDALLVADLIYHAATRNVNSALLVSCDTDFQYAIKRVEDFGCRSNLLAVGVEAPDKLRQSVDDYFYLSTDELEDRFARLDL